MKSKHPTRLDLSSNNNTRWCVTFRTNTVPSSYYLHYKDWSPLLLCLYHYLLVGVVGDLAITNWGAETIPIRFWFWSSEEKALLDCDDIQSMFNCPGKCDDCFSTLDNVHALQLINTGKSYR